MTFSYTFPGDTDISTVRFNIGDTDPNRVILQDEEITFLIDKWLPKNNSLTYVSAMAARSASAKFAGELTVSGDGVSVDLSALQQKFIDAANNLMAQYRQEPGAGTGGPDVGGIDLYEFRDPSVQPTDMGTGMHDNPYAGYQAGGDGPAMPAEYEPYGT